MYELVEGILIRKGNVYDKSIVTSVITENRYRLPSSFSSSDVIVDVGAHVGSFAFACLKRNAGKILGFEPLGENLRICARNLRRFRNRAVLSRAAVWRSDTFEAKLFHTGATESPQGLNFGGGNVIFEDGLQIPVTSRPLDSILSNIREVRLLKLDCESSEWPILFTSKLLDCVAEIAGEFHEIGGSYNSGSIPGKASLPKFSIYTREQLQEFLERHGFAVELEQNRSNIGLFFAKRN